MLQKWSRYRILEKFFDFPRREYLIRELSREIKLAQTSTTQHIKELLKEGIIKRQKRKPYSTLKANLDSDMFKLLKKQNLVQRLHFLISHLEKKIYPRCIVLFGSASRGEDTKTSDIDLFIQAEELDIDLSKFEKKLNRKINLFFEPKIKNLSKELMNNILNGDVLHGYLEVLK